jgi:hypothetical protein
MTTDTCGNLYYVDMNSWHLRMVTPALPIGPRVCGMLINDEVQPVLTLAEEISIYPNPSNGAFTIEMPANIVEARVVVTDMLGRKVKEEQLLSTKTQITLNASPGIYLVSCTAGERRWCRQVTVNR